MILKKPIFLNGRTEEGESYRMLHVPETIDTGVWRADVKGGALMYEACDNCLREHPARYMIVDADNEEEGFAAISYMYGMLREKERTGKGRFSEGNLNWQDEDSEEDEDYIEVGSLADCMEGDEHLPVLELKEVNRTLHGGGMEFLPFTEFMAAAERVQGSDPYWFGLGDKPVCLVRHYLDGPGTFHEKDLESIRFFSDSKYVFVLYIQDEGSNFGMMFDQDFACYEEENDFSGMELNPSLSRAILALTADHIRVTANAEVRKNYHEKLFASWLNDYLLRVDCGEAPELVEKISGIDSGCPSDCMEKVLKLFKHNNEEADVISTEDLRRMGILGLNSKGVNAVTLDHLEGLYDVKKQVTELVRMLEYSRARIRAGMRQGEYHNVFMFLGAPGTAKTTVAKAFGRMLKEKKLLGRDRFISVSGSQLKAGYVGQTAGRVHSLFENYDIILIDEAYSLTAQNHGEMDIFAQEALAQLALELEEHSMDKVVIFAGYGGENVKGKDNKMKEFMTANPGILSRINATIFFPSYTAEEMVQITHKLAAEKGLSMTKAADGLIRDYFENRRKDRAFGNGREARSLVERAELKMAQHCDISAIQAGSRLKLSKRDIMEALAEISAENGLTEAFGLL